MHDCRNGRGMPEEKYSIMCMKEAKFFFNELLYFNLPLKDIVTDLLPPTRALKISAL